MRLVRPVLLSSAALALLAVVSCSSQDELPQLVLRGSVLVSLDLTSADITSATYEISGAGLSSPRTDSLALSNGTASSTVQGLPVGTGYIVTIHAFAGATEICTGSTSVDVIANQVSAATIQLQCADQTGNISVGAAIPNGTASDNAFVQVSGSGIASPILVTLAVSGQSVSGLVKRVPAGLGRLVEVTTRVGSTAACTGTTTVDVVANGTADATGVVLSCGPGTGGIFINGTLNYYPNIHAVLASASSAAPGDTISLTAVASDPDGDPLTYSWSDGSGSTSSFGSPLLAATSYTIPGGAAGTSITFTVSVHDGVTQPRTDTVAVQVAGAAPAISACVKGQVVISQIYGGGGNSGSTLTNDFIELFNKSATSCTMSGWSVQYSAANGTTSTPWSSGSSTLHSFGLAPITLQAGHYFLAGELQGASGTQALPTPDASGLIALSAGSGRVALSSSSTPVVGCPLPANADLMDFVGFGSSANCYEGSAAAPAPSAAISIVRAASGCTDTDQNSTDFVQGVGVPVPRNSATTPHLCP